MKITFVPHSLLTVTLACLLICCGQKNKYQSITNEKECVGEGGIWYNNLCWENFHHEEVLASEVDSLIAARMKIINNSYVTIDGQKFPLVTTVTMDDIIATYKEKEQYNTLIFSGSSGELEQGKEIEFTCSLFRGDAFMDGASEETLIAEGTAQVFVEDLENFVFNISATVVNTEDDSKISKLSLVINGAIDGAGNTTLKVKGKEAYLSGVLGTITYHQIKELVTNQPQVKTLVLTEVPGSINDDINLHTGRLVRNHGITTKVLANSNIASGGVDLFCAGKERIVEEGAKIGIHSWCCINEKTAIEIPKKHPAHKYQISYFTEMLGEKRGYDFYFHTLSAAPFDGVHNMTKEEMEQWGVATQIIEKKK